MAAHAGGSVVCLDLSASGRTFRLHAARPESYETIRADVIDWQGMALSVDPIQGDVPTVAVIEIRGPLEQRAGYHSECGGWADGHDAIADRLCAALADPLIGAIMLVVDSPGGAAAGLQEAVARVLRAKEANPKRIIGFAQEMIASAAFWWVACVCDENYAPASGQVGSIGARSAHGSVAGQLAKEGVEVTFFAWPPGKIALAAELPISELGKARGDRDVRACAEEFMAAVGAARGLSHDDLMTLDADCLSGASAVAAGLVDGIATYEEVLDYALTLASGAGENSMGIRAEGDEPEKKAPPGGDDDGEQEAEGEEPSTACSSCKMANEPNAKFCDQCGASMAAVVASEDGEEDGPPSSKPSPKPGATARAPRTPVTLASLAGLRPGASTPAIISALAPRVAVFDHAAKLAGTSNPMQVIGSLSALAEDAKRGVEAENNLRIEQKKAAKAERWQLCKQLTSAMVPGYERGRVFLDLVDDNGKKSTALAPQFGEMKLDTLRGLVKTLTADRAAPRDPWQPNIGNAKAASQGAGRDPSSVTDQLAAQTGLDPKAMQAAEDFINSSTRGVQ